MTQYTIFGRIAYGNVTGVQQFSMTRSRGIQPGTIQFVVPVIPQVPVGRSAPLMLADMQNTINIPDCLLTSVDGDYSNGEQYTVTLLDYRWRWAYGEISGQYNTIRGGVIVEKTKKSAKDLAEMCLKAMGVRVYNINGLPANAFPEVTWDLENPATALDNLVSSLACVICPQLNGSVFIYKNGTGLKLPKQQGAEFNETIKLLQAPDKIRITAEPTKWEVSLRVWEPFGIERPKPTPTSISSESVVPIDLLTYTPPKGWGFEDPMSFSNVLAKQFPTATLKEQRAERERVRGLAQESIWKIWGFKFPISLPFLPFKITHVNQLVFHSELIGEATIDFQSANQGKQYEVRRRQPFVYGVYYDRKDTGQQNVPTMDHKWWVNRRLLYDGSFSVDGDRGLITFSDPVYLYSPGNPSGYFVKPNLYLRVAISVKDPNTGALWREGWTQPTGYQNGTEIKYVRKSDLRREIVVDPENPQTPKTDNLLELMEEFKTYTKLELDKLSPLQSAEGTYQGFQPIELDGAIEQVSYSIDGSGLTTTRASYGFEHSYYVPSYEERKRTMFLHRLVQEQTQNLNSKADYKR